MEYLKTYEANGVKLHYKQSGTGPPIIFIPGGISDYRTWKRISPKFQNEYTCYVISRRFQFPDQYPAGGNSSVEVNTKDIACFIRDKNIAPAIIIGHSFGGFIALNLALKNPQYVKKLIMEEPIFAPALVSNPKSPFELVKLMFRNFKAGKSFARFGIKAMEPTFKALAKGDTVTAQKSFINGITVGKKTPDNLDELTQQQLSDNIAVLAGENPFNNDIKLGDIRNINCKTLLISGTYSPYFHQFINERLEKVISNVKHISIPNTSHWIHIDKPNEFEKVIKDLLKS